MSSPRPFTQSLPVLNPPHTVRPPAARPGRMRRRRAVVMIVVYVLMVIHILHWRVAGRTMAPVVMSDSMHTLENGELNPGFIFFALTLLSTMVFGRFLCGWACHMGALQDLCAWLMARCLGVRARPFRARILSFIPAILALYMFVWPTFQRDVLLPVTRAWWPALAARFGPVRAFPGLSSHLTTDDMWSRLPAAAVAVPFLLVCGFGMVYFLGSRGLCRYGCPYGGLLAPAERLAPIGIVVDPARCDECGRCTAACGAGVRVLEETRAWGFVTDNRCMRTLDCIEACPRGALSFRPTRPALLRGAACAEKPSVAYDLTWGEEIALTALFGAIFVVIRGLYGVIPMLMDVSIAACATFAGWKTHRLLRDRDVRFGALQLKRAGRLRPAGGVFMGLAVLGAALLAHSAAVQALLWQAGRIDGRVVVPRDVVFSARPEAIPAGVREQAASALRWYSAAGSFRRGGIGLASTPSMDVREAWLHLVRGEPALAEVALRRAMDRNGLVDPLCADLARCMLLQHQPDAAIRYLQTAVGEHPDYEQSRDLLGWLFTQAGRMREAVDLYERVLEARPGEWSVCARLGALHLNAGDFERAVRQFTRAAADVPKNASIAHDLALALFFNGDVDGAVSAMKRAAELDLAAAPAFLSEAAEMLAQAGRSGEAAVLLTRASQVQAGTSGTTPAAGDPRSGRGL